ncbi:hypothetical protein B0H13DRAFT_2394960 [Mycena leptocephala]|nr:hypothetical protein B0H13DRAFT_2394960 [Mycena leptocephala]
MGRTGQRWIIFVRAQLSTYEATHDRHTLATATPSSPILHDGHEFNPSTSLEFSPVYAPADTGAISSTLPSFNLSSRELPSIRGSLSYLLEPPSSPPRQMGPPPLDLVFFPVIPHDAVQSLMHIRAIQISSTDCGSPTTSANDLWFWEEEDEECIEEFAMALPSESFAESVKSMDWDKACQALETRQSRTMVTPLAHVTSRFDCASWRG